MVERHLHQRFQEYLDCFMEADIEAELKRFEAGTRGPVDEDETEAALKVLALALFASIARKAGKILVSGDRIDLLSPERSPLVTISPDLVARAADIVTEISGLEAGGEAGRLVAGLRNGQLELNITQAGSGKQRAVTIGLPSLD